MYAAGKNLHDLVTAAEQVAADAGLDSVAARLRDHWAERDHPGTRAAVVGDFNRGKSTLINRLIGTDVLPTGSVPLTRAFVVVRAIASGSGFLDVRWPSGETERRALAMNALWSGLVLAHELSAVTVSDGQVGPEEPELLLSVPSDWLGRAEVELIDTPGLHEGRVDHLLQTQRAVALSDVVVVAISADSPLSSLERQFLEEELVTKRVPHIVVVLTKVDQLPPGEAQDFLEWFTARIAEISPSIMVVAGPGLGPGGTELVAHLRECIRDLASGMADR